MSKPAQKFYTRRGKDTAGAMPPLTITKMGTGDNNNRAVSNSSKHGGGGAGGGGGVSGKAKKVRGRGVKGYGDGDMSMGGEGSGGNGGGGRGGSSRSRSTPYARPAARSGGRGGSSSGGRGGSSVSNKGYAGSSTSQNLSSEARETIKAFVASKYNAEALSLDLEGCSEQLSSQTGATFANTRFVQEICNIIRDHIPDVRTVNFSNNNITTLSAFRFLAKSAPSLLNICLRSNSIKSIKELDYLRGYSDTLNELILSDNPCVASASPAMYQHEVLTRFPFCKYLDGSQPQPLIQFNLANESTASKVPEDQGSFFDSESSQANAIAFVNQYFPLYDSNRQGLLSAYAHDACFSVTVSKNARGLPKEYCTNSRNLVTSASLSAPGDDTAVLSSAVPLMLCKPLNIVYTLDSFPATSHDLDTMTADSFVVPSTTTTGGNNVLAVSINGTFLEKGDNDKTTIREFHRMFLLIPPRPADNTQWPIVILNDQLHILDGPVTAKPPALPAAVPASAPAANGAAPPQQMAMVQQLSQQFQVDSNLATQALSSNNWNYEVAAQQVQQYMAQQAQQI